jgi:hypothetical protein
MKIAAKASKNNKLANPNCKGWVYSTWGGCRAPFASHSWHVQLDVSKQLPHVGLAQLWQT